MKIASPNWTSSTAEYTREMLRSKWPHSRAVALIRWWHFTGIRFDDIDSNENNKFIKIRSEFSEMKLNARNQLHIVVPSFLRTNKILSAQQWVGHMVLSLDRIHWGDLRRIQRHAMTVVRKCWKKQSEREKASDCFDVWRRRHSAWTTLSHTKFDETNLFSCFVASSAANS